MHKNVFTWLLVIALLFMLWFVTRTKSDYSSSSSSSSVFQTGDQYKDDAINTLPEKVKEALNKLPKEEQDKLKTSNTEDFNNTLHQINYKTSMSKPLYTITGTSSK